MALGKSLILALTIAIAIIASLFASPAVREFLYSTSSFKAIPNLLQQRVSKHNFSSTTTTTSAKMVSKRMPTYFWSHGGPDVQHNTKHPVYPVLQKMGKEITSMKPKAVVVLSAHWMGGKDEINVNNAEFTDLIYDFYGFPSHFYEATYPSVGSPALATKIIQLLTSAGIKASGLSRGLDHGVWSGFSVAFDPASNPLNCPLVQVSLYHSESPAQHYALGRAVSSLRDEGIIVIGAGMSGHNLRDVRFSYGDPRPLPYSVSFDEALKVATEAAPAEREQKMTELVKRPDARQAHPWMDHLMPVYVAAGAAAEEQGKQLWTLQEGSFAWAQYRFGDVVEPGKEA